MSLVDRWIDRIEQAALGRHESSRLGEGDGAGTEFRAGKRLAASGAVTELEVTPGLIEGNVEHRDGLRAAIGVAPLPEPYWTQLSDKIKANPSWRIQLDAHLVPDELAVEMVPDSTAFTPSCTCGTGVVWCRHVVAVAANFGESLAGDPFGVVTALGSNRDAILGPPADIVGLPYGLDEGVSAPAAYRKTPAEPPRVPPVAAAHRTPQSLGVSAPAGSGISSNHLLAVIDDASRRAHDLLTGADNDLYLTIPVGLDVIRRAATGDIDEISAETNLDRSELAAAASAWRVGGAAAVRALRDRWDCPSDQLHEAVAWFGEGAKVRANTVSTRGEQLRLDRQRHWWRLGQDDDFGWMIIAGPASSVADVMALPVHDDGPDNGPSTRT